MTPTRAKRTPSYPCLDGHTHVSYYEAVRCVRGIPEPPTSYAVPLGWQGLGLRK